jgi:hypothetical protein
MDNSIIIPGPSRHSLRRYETRDLIVKEHVAMAISRYTKHPSTAFVEATPGAAVLPDRVYVTDRSFLATVEDKVDLCLTTSTIRIPGYYRLSFSNDLTTLYGLWHESDQIVSVDLVNGVQRYYKCVLDRETCIYNDPIFSPAGTIMLLTGTRVKFLSAMHALEYETDLASCRFQRKFCLTDQICIDLYGEIINGRELFSAVPIKRPVYKIAVYDEKDAPAGVTPPNQLIVSGGVAIVRTLMEHTFDIPSGKRHRDLDELPAAKIARGTPAEDM